MTAIYNESGNKVGEYAYDAWGNCTVLSGAATDVVRYNPIRYRGYYYDIETGLYYLNARYYNPQWRRFISPDGTKYLDPETPNGLNLYAYCNNDPVNYVDPSGHSVKKWGECFFIIGVAAIAIALTIASCFAASAAIAPIAFLYLGITANTTLSITTAVVAATSVGIGAFAIADVQSVITDGKHNYLSFLGNSYDDIKGALYYTSYLLNYMGQYAQPGWGKQTSGTKDALERGDPYGAYTKITPKGNDTTIYDGSGYAITRYDFSHSHGGMNPHIHYFKRWLYGGVLRSNFPKGKIFPFSLP